MSPWRQFRVLCVDDDPTLLENLSAGLRAAGYHVETAPDGLSALRKLNGRFDDFQLVLTDLRMPGLGGLQLIEQSRASGYSGPFVVYSGAIQPDDRQRLRELQVEHVIHKPARSGDIIAILERVQSGV